MRLRKRHAGGDPEFYAMIRVTKTIFYRVAASRGYSLEKALQCVVSQSGNWLTVDETHTAYPREPKPGFVPQPKFVPTYGVGSELKKLLSKIGIVATPNCSCNKRAELMDTHGIEWCENNIDTIVGWLREEATKRKLPFIDAVGKLLVKRAIRNAKKQQSK